MYRNFLFLVFAQIVLCSQCGELIQPINVYQNVIQNVQKYSNFNCVIIMHTMSHSMESQGFGDHEDLMSLQLYFSRKLHIRTLIINFKTFRERFKQDYHALRRPLIVLLNDRPEVKNELRKISHWIDMAHPSWLMFSSEDIKMEEFFSNINLPLDSFFLLSTQNDHHSIIREAYRVSFDGPLRILDFATWDQINGFNHSNKTNYERRRNLFGHALQVVTINDPTISTLHKDSKGKIIHLGGLYGEMLDILGRSLNCTFTFVEAKGWGMPLTNGSWTGSIGILARGNVDLIAAHLVMNAQRAKVIKFTQELYKTNYRVYIKQPKTQAIKWSAYVIPLQPWVWRVLAMVIVISSVMIRVMELIVQRENTALKQTEYATPLVEIVSSIIGAFSAQGLDHSLYTPVRMIHFSIHFLAFFVLAAYSGILIISFTIPEIGLPFHTFKELVNDGSYQLGVVENSIGYTMFQVMYFIQRMQTFIAACVVFTSSKPLMQKAYRELISGNKHLPINHDDGLRRVCEEKKYSFLCPQKIAEIIQPQLDCTLAPLDDVLSTESVAIGVAEHSPFVNLINHSILLWKETGVITHILLAGSWYKADPLWAPITLVDTAPLIAMMGISALIGFLIWTIECAFARIKCFEQPQIKLIHSLLKWRESGILQLLMTKIIPARTKAKDEWKPFGIENITPLMFLLGVAMLWSSLVWSIKCFISKKYLNRLTMVQKWTKKRIIPGIERRKFMKK